MMLRLEIYCNPPFFFSFFFYYYYLVSGHSVIHRVSVYRKSHKEMSVYACVIRFPLLVNKLHPNRPRDSSHIWNSCSHSGQTLDMISFGIRNYRLFHFTFFTLFKVGQMSSYLVSLLRSFSRDVLRYLFLRVSFRKFRNKLIIQSRK